MKEMCCTIPRCVADGLSNHKSRPEVQEALTDGSGFEIRRSATLDENTYYYAMLLKDGTVLRVAREADSIYKVMEYAVPYLLLIVAALLVVCGIVSYYLAEGIIRPIRQIAESGGETGEVSSYEERSPSLRLFRDSRMTCWKMQGSGRNLQPMFPMN